MKSNVFVSMLMAASLGLVGCGEKSSSDGDAGASDEGSGGEAGDGEAGSGGVGEGDGEGEAGEDTGGAETGGGSESGGEEGGVGFIQDPDGGGVSVECSVFEQDCPEGEKCMPWANDGGNSWNATKCSPVDPNPAQPGDACTVEGSGVSGVDNCDVAAMCWDVDPETNEGTCVAFCSGTESDPSCDDPATQCSIANEGVLILCLPTCDPLTQDCAEGQACYPFQDGFVCAPDASAGDGVFGDPCEFLNACDEGLFCADANTVPGCAGSIGCCSEFCELPDGACMGAGQTCEPAFEEGMVPPGYENVGLCLLPQ